MKKRCMAGFLSILLSLSLTVTSFAAGEQKMMTEETLAAEFSEAADQEMGAETERTEELGDTASDGDTAEADQIGRAHV